MINKLIEQYRIFFAEQSPEPRWAVHKIGTGKSEELVHCTVPFIGNEYESQNTKILLYASAENLSTYQYRDDGYLDDDCFAINRHRFYFDHSVSNNNRFYPNVHIQPITDGGLALTALYIYSKFQGVDCFTPAEFLEKICFANYCKYSIQINKNQRFARNIDYAGDLEYLSYSHKYIESEIKLLQPDIIIIPKTIYNTDRTFIDSIKGAAKIIPIYQINSKNINIRIKKYPPMNTKVLTPVLLDWWQHLSEGVIKGKTQENFLSVFTYLDEVMANII